MSVDPATSNAATGDHGRIGVLSVESATDATLQDLVSWILLLALVLIYYVLLEFEIAVLIVLITVIVLFDWNRLLEWLSSNIIVDSSNAVSRLLVRISFDIMVQSADSQLGSRNDSIRLVASDYGLGTSILLLLSFLLSNQRWLVSAQTLSLFFLFHLGVQSFPFPKDFHEFFIYFITIKGLKNVLLVLKLILRLPCLLRFLLFLNKSICVLRLSLSRFLLTGHCIGLGYSILGRVSTSWMQSILLNILSLRLSPFWILIHFG